MRVTAVESTELFVRGPRQIVRVILAEVPYGSPLVVEADGPGVRGRRTAGPDDGTNPGPRTVVVEVPVEPVEPAGTAESGGRPAPGARVPLVVRARAGGERCAADGELVVAEPGWTVWMIPHFHYDPVWWNTQAAYTANWDRAGGLAQAHRQEFQHAGFDLVRLHLDTARREPEYRFVLAEVDYLKPYWNAHPEDRAYLRRLLAEGRLEIVGGTYNEPNTNLTGPEATIRNLVHGIGFQRDVLGGDPATAWQLDAFGHDPQFPGLAAEAGLTSSSWARGPYHQWGPMLLGGGWGDPSVMQFPSEFEWLSPSGRGVPTHYMPAHYSAGWWMDSAPTLEEAEAAVYELFLLLKKVAATRNVLLPVGTDYTPPNKWVTEIHRDWNRRYVSPRFVCGLPRDFFAAVRAEGVRLTPQTRDMNPVYTGKDVSYADTKQAQRHAETRLADAEKFAAVATAVLGAPYPHAALDKAWRQIAYGAHHDAITGSESDQVYLDLMTGWREAYGLGGRVLGASLRRLGEGLTGVAVWNPSSWPRTDLVRVRLTLPEPGAYGVALDPPAPGLLLEHPERHPDGSLAAVDAVFVARDVPALGYRTFRLAPTGDRVPIGWAVREGNRIANATHTVEVDPERGGTVSSLVVEGRELLQEGRVGNELLVYGEHPAHPRFGEGPWHLLPNGEVTGSAGAHAEVAVADCPAGRRITVSGKVGPVAFTQEITLWDGLPRVDLTTHVDDFHGSDVLLRLRWPVRVPGALPVAEVAGAVVGRGFALIDVDSAEHPWTLDNPAHNWFALSSTARVVLRTPAGRIAGARAVGVAEIIAPPEAQAEGLRDLAVALVRQGVTSTCSTGPGPRYGNLAVDSNLPDVRIAVGTPEENPFVAALLDDDEASELRARLGAEGRARLWVPAAEPLEKVWVPSADLTGARDLPVLVVCGEGAVEELVADLADAVVEVVTGVQSDSAVTDDAVRDHATSDSAALDQAAFGDAARDQAAFDDAVLDHAAFDDYTVGLVNRGSPGFAVDPSGALHVSLMRSCTGWLSGVWIDPPRRTAPDGSNFQLQHWTHMFECCLVAAPGDWRDAGLVRIGHDVNHPLIATVGADGPAGESRSFLETGPGLVLTALKAAGNPIAEGRTPGPVTALTARVYEAGGGTTPLSITTTLPLGTWRRAGLLENVTGAAPGTLGGMEIVTLVAPLLPGRATSGEAAAAGGFRTGGTQAGENRTGGNEAGGTAGGSERGGAEAGGVPEAEPHQPVYTRYWLNDTGPAPIGDLPVAVHLSEPDLDVAGPVGLTLTIASCLTEDRAEGVVTLTAPGGWTVTPAVRPYVLPPGGHATVPVRLTPPPGAEPGLYLLTAGTKFGGQAYEDVTRLHLFRPGEGGRRSPGLEVTVEGLGHPPGLRLRPGGGAEVVVRLHSGARSPMPAQAQLVSPWQTFEMFPEWNGGTVVPPGDEAWVRFPVRVPPDTRPGRWWALVKIACAGWVHYTDTIEIEVEP
ncbi:alpha-mannosidase [Microbispora cellulosiformans]|uniref:Alpha-mannosidase n=1 Tax=Microbispora cellulosiformans TaxID=2614688 RepID=A0A5J5K5K2_9ACTN|nr:NEW3 domain-containing protein [Microbispora cellulosiformans]KAA9378360.1 alpha-mannosidase [Microbispora cellulosiformans]